MPKKLRVKSLVDLGSRLGYPTSYLEELSKRAHKLYRYWSKPKPAGGIRRFSEPKEELKRVQNKIHRLLQTLNYADTSHYGIRGRSNITNARVHQNQQVILKFDIKGFFPSVHPKRVHAALIRELDCSPAVASVITRLVTVNHSLPQGAPTSTDIANIVTLRLQRRLSGLAVIFGYRFTSYSDDLTFSGKKAIFGFVERVRALIKSEGFSYKASKELIATKAMSQAVTGVDLGHGIGVNRRRRKFWIAEVFNAKRNYQRGLISEKELQKVEARFHGRLCYVKAFKKQKDK